MKSVLKALAASILVASAFPAFAENLLPDTAFSKESGWSVWANKPVKEAGGSISMAAGKVVVKSPTLAKQDVNNIQILRAGSFEAGKRYKLKFTVEAEKAGQLVISYMLGKSPYTKFASAELELAPGTKDYECVLAVKESAGKPDAGNSLRFCLGSLKNVSVTLSNISIDEDK